MRRKRFRVRVGGLAHRWLERLHMVLNPLHRTLPVVASFVLGVWVNAASDPAVDSPADAAARVYDVGERPIAWLVVLTSALVVLVPVLRLGLRGLLGTEEQAVRLSERLYEQVIDEDLWPYARGRIAWGCQLVLQSCPRIGDGWRLDEVRVVADPTDFRWPTEELATRYQDWLAAAEPFVRRSRAKYRLMENPASFLDDPVVTLRVQRNGYGEAVFTNRVLAAEPEVRRRGVERALAGNVELPHLVVLHLVVATRDGHVLLARRSHKVAHYPGTWSCSLEEQLADEDLAHPETDVMAHWLTRALTEELGLTRAEALRCDARLLAVFLEADMLNVALAGLATLDLGRDELDRIIADRPREDYEFQDWTFVPWSGLARLLVRPDRPLHPSSGLRMFLAGLVKYGVHSFGERIERELRGAGR
ncbi:MAG TPA: hypothetical protein VGD67_10120 [Pseudonocardiaceae bacterium]